ncbi:DUF1559 domain-containing protein [Planctomyces sp. SH-PL14]|uniref:DUF1559 family PulG-like putative transporter n=1 Tax=Planctomyces sp. SH-PL14 TaxID=1632864 RepID=UPI00078BFF54|nr:DUF1559 domain-containing protein [Planctomyces sp. SH-PL14]AMV19551.1 hypothetical protein VT03_16775 [Planctomyces sp. SH-PL14]
MRSLSVRSTALACALFLIGCDKPAGNAPAPPAPPSTPAPPVPPTVPAAPVPPPSPPASPPAATTLAVPMPTPPGSTAPAVPMPTPPAGAPAAGANPLPEPKSTSETKPASEPKLTAVAAPAKEPASGPPAEAAPLKAASTPPAAQVVAQANPPAAPRDVPVPDLSALPEVRLLGDDAVAVAVIRLDRLRQWPVFDVLRKAGAFREPERMMQPVGLTVDDFVRAAVVVDQDLVNLVAQQAGLTVQLDEGVKALQEREEIRNTLKMIAISFHNYHETFGKFPRANGGADGKQTGLSWRVYMLPYLGHAALYNQFHTDEPWDSEHNKTLIEKMPAMFRSPGVDAPDKTSYHVFTGKGSLFDGETGIGLRDITDGTSNTLLAVVSGPDTAEIWTKPGGLPFDAAKPKENKAALGELPEGVIQAVFADGAVRPLPVEIEPQTLTNLIQRNDGNVVDVPDVGPGMGRSRHEPMPTFVVTFGKDLDRGQMDKVSRGGIDVDGEKLYVGPGIAVWIAGDRTAVMGMQSSVEKMIRDRKTKRAAPPVAARLLNLGADASLAVDLRSQSELLEQVAARNPLLGIIQQVESLLLEANVTKPVGQTLLELVVMTADEESAKALSQIVTPALKAAKQQYQQLRIPTPAPEMKSGKDLADKTVASAEITQKESRVALRIPVPEGFATLPDLLKPAVEAAGAAAERSQRMNNLKMVGLAFHNFHDVYGKFPGAGRAPEKNAALSWRVHLLPFLDQAPLYEQFHLDEAWDSEHNKTLIEKMPALFKVKGVDKPGMTTLHVFTGKGAPFAEDRTPEIREFTDGTSNTILVVQAAPDTAQIWTKPGGLDFDPKKPLESLGKLPEEFFLTLFADGAVRTVAKSIDLETLRRLIEFQDGEPLDNF